MNSRESLAHSLPAGEAVKFHTADVRRQVHVTIGSCPLVKAIQSKGDRSNVEIASRFNRHSVRILFGSNS